MKQLKSRLWSAAAMVLALGVMALFAQEAPLLTRAQWLKKIGASVTNADVLRQTLSQVAPDERVEFAQRVLKAVTRLPVSPEEKAAAFVRTSVACIAGATGEVKQKVIAEVFAGVPVEHLPVVTEELAKRFDQEHNRLSDEQYEKVASDTLRVATERNAKTDAPSVRNTFVILSFLRGAKNPALQNKLITQLPDDRMRNLSATWIPSALKDRNYAALLAAADADELPLRMGVLLRLIGHANLDRLLADLNANRAKSADLLTDETGSNVVASAWIPLSQVQATSGIENGGLPSTMLDYAPNYGMSRAPLYPAGYQNQGTTIECPCVPPVRESPYYNLKR